MHKRIVSLCIIGMLWSCQHQRLNVVTSDPIITLETQKEFLIRSNPCGCIVDAPELAYEVKLGRHWQRAFIEPNSSDLNTYQELRSAFLKSPRSIQTIEGEFTGVFYQWLSGHNAPGISISRVYKPRPTSGDKSTTPQRKPSAP